MNYITFLSQAAHARNMSLGLKNGGDIVPRVIDLVQWEINEQCIQYDECNTFQPFIAQGKPVFSIEYPADAPDVSAAEKASICNGKDTAGFSTILKNMDLDNWVEVC